MQAVNIAAEFRKAFPARVIAPTEARLLAWADNKVQFDGWVKDDGDYYTAEEWNMQFDMQKEWTYLNEHDAQAAERDLRYSGYQTSPITYDDARGLYVFDAV